MRPSVGPQARPARSRRILLACALAAGASLAAAGAAPAAGRYQGAPLADALQELRARGLKIVFTTSVVRPEMTVAAEPAAGEPRAILDELLAPFGLEVRDGPGGTLVVVSPAAALSEEDTAIAGFVFSRGDSRPLPAVEIRIVGSDLRTTSDRHGSFVLERPGAGLRTLEARRPGFVVERLADVEVRRGRETRVTFLLTPAPLLEEQLRITPSTLSLLRGEPVPRLGLSRADILSLPHFGDDFFRALSLLPGATANDVTAQFHVRGGRRDETQILLDGQELYETYHLQDFDSALSVVPPDVLESVDLSTGGFAADYGDRMSGVLDMTTQSPRGPPRGRAGVSILAAHAGGGGSFAERRGSWLARLRRGGADLAGELIGGEEPRYSDAFGKLDYEPRPTDSLRANVLLADDEFDFSEVTGDGGKRTETDYETRYAWLTHQRILGSKASVESGASLSRVRRDRRGEEAEEDGGFGVVDRRRLDVLGVRQRWSFEATDRHYLRGGFELRRFETRYDYRAESEFVHPLAVVRDNPAALTLFDTRFDDGHDSLYLADRIQATGDLTLELGGRLDRHTQTDERILSPRLNLAWGVGAHGVLRLAWGRFTQSQRPYELQVADGETRFSPVERAEHRVLGYERLLPRLGPARDVRLRGEIYRREVANPRPRWENLYEAISTFPELEPDRVRIAPARSIAEGVELFVRARLGERWSGWVSYTLAATDDVIDGRRVPRSFDQTHGLDLDLGVRVGRRWDLNMAWRYHTGWPTTALSLVAGEDEEGETVYAPRLGPLNHERLSDYHRLDLRASRRSQLRHGALTFFIDVQNVYDRVNVAGFDVEIDAEEGTLRQLPEGWAGILPSLGVSVEF